MVFSTVLLLWGMVGVVLSSPTLYNQRQEGRFNVRADVTDSQLIVVPSKEIINIGLTMLGKSSGGRRALGERILHKLGFARASLSPNAVDVDRNLARVQPLSPDHNLNSNSIPTEPKKQEFPINDNPSVKKDLKDGAPEAPGAAASLETDNVQGSIIVQPEATTPAAGKTTNQHETKLPEKEEDKVKEDLQKKVDELKYKEELELENLKREEDKQGTKDEIKVEKTGDKRVDEEKPTQKKDLKKKVEENLKNSEDLKKEDTDTEKAKPAEDLKKDETTEVVKENEKTENLKKDEKTDHLKEKEASTEAMKKKTMKMEEEEEILTLIQSGIEECGPDGHRNSQGICVYTPIIS